MLIPHQHSGLLEIHCFGVGERIDQMLKEKAEKEKADKEKAGRGKEKADDKTEDKTEDKADKQ